jgi:hypothetical protein
MDENQRLADALARLRAKADETLAAHHATANEIIAGYVGIINRLIALCAKYGIEREAREIASGEKILPPPKKGPGRPRVKDERWQRAVAAALEATALQRGRRGAGARLARALAEDEIGSKSRARQSEVEKRTLLRQNDLSNLPPETKIRMAYYVRCANAGESLEAARTRLDAVEAGDDKAARKLAGILHDLLPIASHKKSRK